jgi:hypothetical protein
MKGAYLLYDTVKIFCKFDFVEGINTSKLLVIRYHFNGKTFEEKKTSAIRTDILNTEGE